MLLSLYYDDGGDGSVTFLCLMMMLVSFLHVDCTKFPIPFPRSLNYLSYFCGHQEHCSRPGRESLLIAKLNVMRFYAVVGLSDDLEAFFRLLEERFPIMFKGAADLYKQSQRFNRDKDINKHKMSNATIAYMKKVLWPEYAFYKFIKQRFHITKLAGIWK
jgi:hypothetical protein